MAEFRGITPFGPMAMPTSKSQLAIQISKYIAADGLCFPIWDRRCVEGE